MDYHNGQKKDKLKFLNDQPRIKPNYGKKAKITHSLLPKTNVTKVLLYENAMQANLLDIKTRYLHRQKKRIERMFVKSEYTVKDQMKINRRAHEQWHAKYDVMKNDFIKKYGISSMPDFDEELEAELKMKEEGILAHARIAPPINILCFYIMSGLDKRAQERRKERECRATYASYVEERDRLMEELSLNSSDDPRFKCLAGALAPLQIETDGYRQLSPTYEKIPVSQRWKPGTAKHYRHGIVLPAFYLKQRRASLSDYDGDEEDEEVKTDVGNIIKEPVYY